VQLHALQKLGCPLALFSVPQKWRRGNDEGISPEKQGRPGGGNPVVRFILTASALSKFGNVLRGVNMRLADEKDLAGIELRYPDGRAWSGTGGFGYVQEARIIGTNKRSELTVCDECR
jgi:hypothetical protein